MQTISQKVLVRGLGIALAAACCGALMVSPPQEPKAVAQGGRPVMNFVPNEVLVQFKAGTTEQQRAAAFRRVSGQAVERIHTPRMMASGAEALVRLHVPGAVPDALGVLKRDSSVQVAEPNWVYTHEADSNDTYYTNGSLWGMYGDGTTPANQYGGQAGEAWAAGHTGSSGVYVGVIDEGIQTDHVEFNSTDPATSLPFSNIWTNPFDPIDGRDNDGNGYVDDTNGWDFANNDRTVYDGGSAGKLDAHGTHVSGTIGAVGGNGIGVAGVNWRVTLISGKFLGRNGGTTANAIKAVDYFTDLKTRHGLNIVATNNSWGGGGFSQALQDAIQRANNAGILFVAAAGNGGADGVGDNNDSVANYPSNYPNDNIIAVAAITSTGAKASYSNYGATNVDIGAPGSNVLSTVPYNKLAYYSGTSMATPHVTGAAALYASTHPGATAAQIKSAILSSAIPTASLAGKCVAGGRLNVSGF